MHELFVSWKMQTLGKRPQSNRNFFYLGKTPKIRITPAYARASVIARSLRVTRVGGQRRRRQRIAASIVSEMARDL